MERSEPAQKEIDWVGKWYLVARKLGRNDLNLFGRGLWNSKTRTLEQVERRDFSHSEMDGAGAMVTYMKELGDNEIDFPVSSRNISPPLWKRPQQLLRSQKLMSQGRARWAMTLPEKKAAIDDFAVFVFLKDEALQLREYCRSRGFSPNAWILSLLQQEASLWLEDRSSTQGWLLPVNMRGGVRKKDHAINHSSAVPLFVSAQSTPKDIHTQMKERLSAEIHWGNWWAYNMSRFFSERRMEEIYKKSSVTNFWMGTLSDMGLWQSGQGYQSLGENEVWFAAPPGSINYPVSCIPFGFNGNLSFTIKVHPSITSTEKPHLDLAQRLEQRMRSELGL